MADFVQRCVTVVIFAEPRTLDHCQGNRLAVHFRVDRFYAGRAVERSQRSEYQCQRLAGVRQAAGSPPLDLDRVGPFDLS